MPEPAPGEVQDEERDAGGDPACRLAEVCDACGRLDDGPPSAVCSRCGAPRSGGSSAVDR